MWALDWLGVSFARARRVGLQMPGVGAPIIGRKAGEPTGLQPCLALPKDRRFVAPKDIRQDRARMMLKGMPRPAWGPFVADTTPPLLHLGFPRARHGYRHLLRMYGAQPGRVDQR